MTTQKEMPMEPKAAKKKSTRRVYAVIQMPEGQPELLETTTLKELKAHPLIQTPDVRIHYIFQGKMLKVRQERRIGFGG